MQPERADLGLQYPGVQLLGLAGARSRCGHGLPPFFRWRAIRSPASRPGGTKSGRTSSPGHEGQGSLAVISRSVASPAERIPGIQLSAATPPLTQRHRRHGSKGAISAVRSGSRVRLPPRRQSVYMLEFAGLLAGLPLMPK